MPVRQRQGNRAQNSEQLTHWMLSTLKLVIFDTYSLENIYSNIGCVTNLGNENALMHLIIMLITPVLVNSYLEDFLKRLFVGTVFGTAFPKLQRSKPLINI